MTPKSTVTVSFAGKVIATLVEPIRDHLAFWGDRIRYETLPA